MLKIYLIGSQQKRVDALETVDLLYTVSGIWKG
jgi:hypothetical protein